MTIAAPQPFHDQPDVSRPPRREILLRASLVAGAMAFGVPLPISAQQLAVLDVAYAGSMGSLMEGPIRKAAAASLQLDMHGRGQGANALAQLLAGGSVIADVFLPISAGPMQTVFQAGMATLAEPIARTEMVIAYSPKSRFAARLNAAARGQEPWWKILEESGFRFQRSDPAADPQGRNIIFSMMLAAKLYKQPDLVEKVLGATINPRQINMETTLQARLQSGEVDASSAYRIQPGPFNLPYISLPAEINLSGEEVHAKNPDISLTLNGKTYIPEPLLYYAAVLKGGRNPTGAAAFVTWLKGAEAQALFRQYAYDSPAGATVLHA